MFFSHFKYRKFPKSGTFSHTHRRFRKRSSVRHFICYFLREFSLCSRVVVCCLRSRFFTFAQPHFHSCISSGVTGYQNEPKYLVSGTMWKGAFRLSLHWVNSYSKYEASVGKYNIIWVNSYSKYEASVGKYTMDSSVGNIVKYMWNFSGGKFWMLEAQTNHVLA